MHRLRSSHLRCRVCAVVGWESCLLLGHLMHPGQRFLLLAVRRHFSIFMVSFCFASCSCIVILKDHYSRLFGFLLQIFIIIFFLYCYTITKLCIVFLCCFSFSFSILLNSCPPTYRTFSLSFPKSGCRNFCIFDDL